MEINCPRCGAALEEVRTAVGPVRVKGVFIQVPYRRYEHCGLVWAEEDQRVENKSILKKARYAPDKLPR